MTLPNNKIDVIFFSTTKKKYEKKISFDSGLTTTTAKKTFGIVIESNK